MIAWIFENKTPIFCSSQPWNNGAFVICAFTSHITLATNATAIKKILFAIRRCVCVIYVHVVCHFKLISSRNDFHFRHMFSIQFLLELPGYVFLY